MDPSQRLLAVAIVAAGTALQASIGFGFALVSAPLLVLLERQLVPGPVTACALALTLSMAVRERHAIDGAGIKPALLGRLLGTPPAAVAVGTVSATAFDFLFGFLVLGAVAVSLVHRHVRPTPWTVFGASTASAFMGTISSIGGPPLALVYQSARGPRLRATLSTVFAMGCVISLVALALVGRMGRPEWVHTAWLLPGVALGFLLARPLAGHLDRGATRPYVLALSTVAAVVVLARAFA